MELKLKKAGHDYYEPLAFTPFSCETMRESIVPDSCADIARIVETTGMVYLTGREMTGDGRFCASGAVDVKKIVTHRFALEDIQAAFDEAVNNKTDLVKAVIKI